MTETGTPTSASVARSASQAGTGRFIARSVAVTGALTGAGALFGLVRDQTIAQLFGAGGATDAFLVSWTVPEVAATLLIEDAMALVLVPAFSLALARRGATARSAPGPDPVRALLAATLPRLCAVLVVTGAVLAAGAPLLVRLLAPGLPEYRQAVDCTRLTAGSVLAFGVAGYCSAALRAHRCFPPPAAIYLVYNLGIVATLLALHSRWGVQAAAAGVAVGGALMVLVQVPPLLRRLRRPSARRGWWPRVAPLPAVPAAGRVGRIRRAHRALRVLRAHRAGRCGTATGPAARAAAVPGAALLVPVAVFTLTRQAQVLVERFLAAPLTPGAISHLNYAQKVAQLPMVLSLLVCTVTFPLVARAMADGDPRRARERVERDIIWAALIVLPGAAYVVACAPQLVELLFERGAFDGQDTAATASVLRIYALGLLGHSMVGALIRPFFAAARPVWYPAAAMAAGLLLTVLLGAVAVRFWGIGGIAAANAAGITLTAALLLRGLGPRVLEVRAERVAAGLGRLLPAAFLAGAAGRAAASLCGGALPAAATAAPLVCAVFLTGALAARSPETVQLVTTVRRTCERRSCHVR